MPFDPQQHWAKIYAEKDTRKVSWYQLEPKESLDWIEGLHLQPQTSILDVGGGDSRLPDYLLKAGYVDINVLDISARALENSQERLGKDAEKINWIHRNILDYKAAHLHDVWHDRAAFHFLKEEEEILRYRQIAEESLKVGGYLILATFSNDGPLKCSGLNIKQYREAELINRFEGPFQILKHRRLLHETPSGGQQEFLFALFQRR